jgi:hypothetical protein
MQIFPNVILPIFNRYGPRREGRPRGLLARDKTLFRQNGFAFLL